VVLVTGINCMVLFQEVGISVWEGCHAFWAVVLNPPPHFMRITDAWVVVDQGLTV
jgi:hypothetical protein